MPIVEGVEDQKPPRLADDDRATLTSLLRYQRESFVRKVTGVDTASARTALVGSGTTLLWLTQHMAEAEQTWIISLWSGRGNVCTPRRGQCVPVAAAVC